MKPLISKLMQMRWAGWNNPFNSVLTKKNAPPRYFDYIKRPMNLTYVRENLMKSKYSTVSLGPCVAEPAVASSCLMDSASCSFASCFVSCVSSSPWPG